MGSQSCPLSDCPCGHYKGNGNSGGTSASTNAASSQSATDDSNQAQSQQTKPEPLKVPALIYQTRREMDDYDARDMHHGDLSEPILKEEFGLTDVSAKVNAYTGKKFPPLTTNPYGMYQPPGDEGFLSLKERSDIMFDEFRDLSAVYSWHGAYKSVIDEMITHMQQNSGEPFSSSLLDQALKEQIENDDSDSSSLKAIQTTLETYIDWKKHYYPSSNKSEIHKSVSRSVLPRFDDLKDYTNGLVICVHDIWSAQITLQSLEINNNQFTATIHYRVQDHFGLDDGDLTPTVKLQRLFRIWFTLQRWECFNFKPFITEMNATITISGKH
ncbi:DUF3289 family protein [Vibrio aerogenes]